MERDERLPEFALSRRSRGCGDAGID